MENPQAHRPLLLQFFDVLKSSLGEIHGNSTYILPPGRRQYLPMPMMKTRPTCFCSGRQINRNSDLGHPEKLHQVHRGEGNPDSPSVIHGYNHGDAENPVRLKLLCRKFDRPTQPLPVLRWINCKEARPDGVKSLYLNEDQGLSLWLSVEVRPLLFSDFDP